MSRQILFLVSLVTASFAQGLSFTDVPDSHPNADGIRYVQSEGIVSGYPDGAFRPDQPITRAEFVKIVMGAVATQENINTCMDGPRFLTVGFPDIPSNAWFAPYICIAKKSGIIKGYPDGSFRPGNPINFVEVAKILSFALQIASDAGHTAPSDAWYKPYVLDLEVQNAIPISIQSFNQNITRGEMAEMIYRLKTGTQDKPSQTYESLSWQEVVFGGFRFLVPGEWKVGPNTYPPTDADYSILSRSFTVRGQPVAEINCPDIGTGGAGWEIFHEDRRTFSKGSFNYSSTLRTWKEVNGSRNSPQIILQNQRAAVSCQMSPATVDSPPDIWEHIHLSVTAE